MKIISGGQSGADLAGNFFAEKHGIDTEINTFKKFKPIHGELPNDIKINYVCNMENYSANLRCRTRYNVKNSDITIILLNKPIKDTRGSKLTLNYCKELKKRCLYVNVVYYTGGYYCNKDILLHKNSYLGFNVNGIEDVMTILKTEFETVEVLNIAGQRDLDEQLGIKFLEKLLLDR